MENKTIFFNVLDHIKQYVITKINIVYLKSLHKVFDALANLISNAILLIVFVFFLFFLSISLALFLGKILKELYWGFALVSACYMLLFACLYLFRKQMLEQKINNHLVKKFFEKQPDNE